MPDNSDRQLDRYLAGELSAPGQRELAQAALDDPELFDQLTAAAIVKAALRDDQVPETVDSADAKARPLYPPVSGFPSLRTGASVRRPRLLTWTATIAAVAASVALVLFYRSPGRGVPAVAVSVDRPSATGDPAAAAAATAVAPQPIILDARLDRRRSTDEFRTLGANRRDLKTSGLVTAIDGAGVTLDLGSLDGLASGSVLQVVRGGGDASPVGRVTIVTVFRERARGRATSGEVKAGDRVDIPPAILLGALLEQVDARLAAGDDTTALSLAQRATALAPSPDLPPADRRRALSRLGALEHWTGAGDDALRHLRAAMDALDTTATDAERAETLNELGAVLIERGDYTGAEGVLQLAQTHATGAAGVRVANNLAAVAELRGDRPGAEALYRSALSLAGGAAPGQGDREAIEKNLERLNARR